MGADLICYIALGPAQIDLDEAGQAAIAAEVRKYLDACIASTEQLLLGHDHVPDPQPGPIEAKRSISFRIDSAIPEDLGPLHSLAELRSHPDYKDLIRGVLIDCDRGVEAPYVFTSTTEDLVDEVQSFVKIWNEEQFCRDLATRRDPRSPDWKIVVAGELSWGDEPDGWGYQALKKAFGLTIAQLLGVR